MYVLEWFSEIADHTSDLQSFVQDIVYTDLDIENFHLLTASSGPTWIVHNSSHVFDLHHIVEKNNHAPSGRQTKPENLMLRYRSN